MSTTVPLTPTAYRNTLLADRIRAQLFADLGPLCAECGIDLTTTDWQVNHIYKRDWSPRKRSRYQRHLRYRKEAERGLVNLLCKRCNEEVYRPVPMPTEAAPPATLCPF